MSGDDLRKPRRGKATTNPGAKENIHSKLGGVFDVLIYQYPHILL
jgi:hypothetical protein